MIPKKANKLYSQVAEDLNIEEDLVDKFIEYYYKTIKEHLADLKHPRINVDGLGHFNAMHSIVKSRITKFTKSLDNHDTSTFKAYHNKKSLEIKLDQLANMDKMITEEQARKDNFKKTKNENSSKSNLEE